MQTEKESTPGRDSPYEDTLFLAAIQEIEDEDTTRLTTAPNIHKIVETKTQITERTVYNRLESLEERGLVDRVYFNENHSFWELTDTGEKELAKEVDH